jgi:four helix bundle protein
MTKQNPHSTFEDLEVYQVAREFRKVIYRVTKPLPDIEKYGLAGQVRRAALSLTNNIAEGHGRYHYLDQIKSLEELIDDLNVCEDEQYLPAKEIASLKQEGWRLRQLIDGYICYLRDQKNSGGSSLVQETSSPYNDADEISDDSRFSI